MHATLELVKQLVPQRLHRRTWIAGGAAICPRLADDVDVWILNGANEAATLRKDVRARWPALACWAAGPTTPPEPDPPSIRTEDPDTYLPLGEFATHGITLIGSGRVNGSDQPIQVLTTSIAHIDQLLATFDLSCHAWAIPLVPRLDNVASWHQLHFSKGATLPSELPRVLTWATPGRTLGRLYKVLQRYGWASTVGDHPDFAKLQSLHAPTAGLDLSAAA